MKARPLGLCLLSAVLCGLPALAQTEPRPDAAKPDGSGQLEKRRQEMLRRFDVNGDGKLDEAEKAAMKEARKKPAAVRGSGDIGSLGGSAEPAGLGGGDRYLREMMKRYDKDGDGKLDETELAELIKNRNAAGPGAPGARLREQMVKLFDKDGDGQLNPDERAAAEQFRADQVKRYDKNGDGQLDAEERAEAMRAFLADHPELVPPGK
ncbi:MAG: EF-hand domain-containing protein [Lacunisphaera sp.]|nr:EF-hand domain-containing protein [Lacunisphaera sp.]